MPFILYIYLATEILAPFAASLLILNAILLLGNLLPLLERIFSFGIGGTDFIRIWFYMSPQMLLFSIPMASMMGVIIAFTRMNNDNEILALKTSGISLLQMLRPVLFFGFATCLLTLATATVLIPKGMVAMNQLLFNLAKGKIEQGIQEKTFSEGLEDVVLYVEEVASGDRSWRGVYLSDLRDAQNPMTVIAKDGTLAVDSASGLVTMNLNHGSMHLAREDRTQTIVFENYTLNLPLQPPEMGHGSRSSMTQAELLARAAELGPEHPHQARFITEYHQRLALPVGCFLLSVMGLSLSQMGQGSRMSLGVPLGLVSFVGYYVLLTAAKSFSENGELPAALSIWLPNLIFLVITLYLLRRSALELGNPWLDRIILLLQEASDRLRHRQSNDDSGKKESGK